MVEKRVGAVRHRLDPGCLLTLFDANHATLDTLHFAGDYTQSDFLLRYDGVSGTGINYSGPDTREYSYQVAGAPDAPDATPAFWHVAAS